MTAHELAQLNLALPLEPLTEPRLAEFVELLEPVNALAEAAPGFCWRLVGDAADDATAVRGFGDDRLIVNLTVWCGLDDLAAFVYGGLHREVMGRRREWFERMGQVYTVCWWVPTGHRPDILEAEARLELLRRDGPSPEAFTLQRSFDPPGTSRGSEATHHDDRLCPA